MGCMCGILKAIKLNVCLPWSTSKLMALLNFSWKIPLGKLRKIFPASPLCFVGYYCWPLLSLWELLPNEV